MKLIVLDLDETLIHATKKKIHEKYSFQVFNYFVYKRPFLDVFLSELKNHFKVAVWSSASDDYVAEIVAKIFPENYPLEFVWGRSKCTLQIDSQNIDDYGYFDYFNHMNYVKILKKVAKKKFARLEDILIVDDTPRKCKYNYGNAIYPTEFLGDSNDSELPLLLDYLISIKEVENVRTLEKRNWKNF
ncbi:HAD family hydrolase [Flavobacterium sp. NRK F7]|uniref:HAD family hydrolase n=1 Tax=Flavobacterium sp. NRK F7 TaxID=2954930 RepID=UPI00209192CD|nr:HAD family hydrolase [Flavobacterium sp. NRK F7]MCO6163502.1 HAD family hydrolase [Flavobacterium sp. NRK F7]